MQRPNDDRLHEIRTLAAPIVELHTNRRAAAIEELVQHARQNGGTSDRMYWAMTYDFKMAPTTTNRAMLDMIGADTNDLGEIVWGLACWSIFLTKTDHLSDEALLARLQLIIDEPVRCVAGADTREWLDLRRPGDDEVQVPTCDRSALLPTPPELKGPSSHSPSFLFRSSQLFSAGDADLTPAKPPRTRPSGDGASLPGVAVESGVATRQRRYGCG